MKSGGSGASSATRSPGATPASRRPSAIDATRSASAANESDVATTDGDRRRVVGLARDERGRGARPRSPAAGARRSERRLRLEQPLDPRVGERRDVLLLDDEMPGEREPVELGLRQPRAQVGGEAEVEDRIALAPGEQHGHVELGQRGRRRQPAARTTDAQESSGCRPRSPRSPAGRRLDAYGREIRAPRLLADAAVRRRQRRPQEGGGSPAGEVAQQLVAREADRQRHARPAASRRRCWRAGSRAPAPGARAPSRARSARPSRGRRRRPGLRRRTRRGCGRDRRPAARTPAGRCAPRAPSRPGRRRSRGSGRRAAGGTSATCSDHVGLPWTQTTVSGGSRPSGGEASSACTCTRSPSASSTGRLRDQAGSIPRRSRRLASNAAGAGLTR